MVAHSGNHKRPRSESGSGNASGNSKIVPGKCWAVGCQQKVTGWTKANNWKLCGTCLLKLKGSGVPVKMKDGNLFGSRAKAYKAQLEWFDSRSDDEKAKALVVLPAGKKSKAQKNRNKRGAKKASKNDSPASKKEKGQGERPPKVAKLALGWEATPSEDLFYQC